MTPSNVFSRVLKVARNISSDDLIILVGKMSLPDFLQGRVERLIGALTSDSVTMRHKAAIVFALVYLVTFNDVLPDLFAFGLMDDLAVISSVLASLPTNSG